MLMADFGLYFMTVNSPFGALTFNRVGAFVVEGPLILTGGVLIEYLASIG